MTPEQFRDAITIAIVPEQPEVPYMGGGLAGEQTFWLHTVGMSQFERPELEMIQVPAIFVGAAAKLLNHWGQYSIDDKPIKADEKILIHEGLPVLVRATAVENEWYTTRGVSALRLVPEAVGFECAGCGKGSCGVH